MKLKGSSLAVLHYVIMIKTPTYSAVYVGLGLKGTVGEEFSIDKIKVALKRRNISQ